VGATLGLKHCDAKCEKEWQPLLAPPHAQPHGYWSIYVRPDGKRQWAYREAALFTHVTDPPGTLYGNETYDIRYDDGFGNSAPEEFGMGLLWRALVP
jgi:predicted lipoprotein with Yx(FWY)xxD motif